MTELKPGDHIMSANEPGKRFVVIKIIPEMMKGPKVIPAAVHCKEIVKFQSHHEMPWVTRFLPLEDVKIAPARRKR